MCNILTVDDLIHNYFNSGQLNTHPIGVLSIYNIKVSQYQNETINALGYS